MKSDALLVNTSRGPVIDEAALLPAEPVGPGWRPLTCMTSHLCRPVIGCVTQR